MIISTEITTTISHLNIEHYKSIGFINIKCNQKIKVLVVHLPKDSNLKIEVKCDICENHKIISYQKYNKNISRCGFYTCDNSCAQIKNKMTLKERYNDENYNNADMQKETVRIKYDKITNDIIRCGYINCIKCKLNKNLDEFLFNHFRYKHICRECRNYAFYTNRNKNPHILAWRNILRGYLLRNEIKKNDSTFNLLKYTPDDLRKHISDLFTLDMDWSNYGTKWQIDHIVHVSFFRSDAPVHIVNGLLNLRPLDKFLNMSRHNKLDNDCLSLISNYQTYVLDEYINQN